MLDIKRQRYQLDADARLEEATGLAMAIGVLVVNRVVTAIRQVKPATLFGSGQLEELRIQCEQDQIELVIIDGALTPIQQRNLETALDRKVIDRTGLILEIFGERAKTAEGRLQVELAHLDYQQSRLVRSWTHLERQRGGFGFLGGPGETQIEADRRQIRDRMGRLRRDLEQVRKTRTLQRARRERAPWPVISLVGYTNAGKSTLFNRLTGADVMAEDLLFATLDPTMRAIALPGVEKAILSDTVGFISDLPTQLVAAFRATLEEVTSSDIICHVRDMANSDAEVQKREVLAILNDLGVIANEAAADSGVPIIEVWNKCDLLDDAELELVRAQANASDDVVLVSAVSGSGVGALVDHLSDALTAAAKVYVFNLPVTDGRSLAWLHKHGTVLDERIAAESPVSSTVTTVTARLSPSDFGRFQTLRQTDEP